MKKTIYILFASLTFLLSSCQTITDDLEDCIAMRMFIELDDPEPVNIPSDIIGNSTLLNDVENIRLYLFEKDGTFIQDGLYKKGKVIELPFKDRDSIIYFAVGYGSTPPDFLPKFKKGHKLRTKELEEIFFSLKPAANFQRHDNIVESPQDFLLASDIIPALRGDNPMAPNFVYLKRICGAVVIKTKNLREYINNKYKDNENLTKGDDDFTFIIGETKRSVTYDGELASGSASYKAPAYLEQGNVIVTPMFNTFMTLPGKTIDIFIYKGNTQIVKATTKMSTGLTIRPGQLTRIEIDFKDIPNVEGGFELNIGEWDNVNIDAKF